jgi:leader peptidase (prepilin peptidase)/N-methyltransferase
MAEIQPEDDHPLLTGRMLAWAAGLSIPLFAMLALAIPPVAAAFTAYLFFTMALITLTDLRHFIVPDVLSLPAIPAGLLAQALVVRPDDWLAGVIDGLNGAAIGAGIFYLVRAAYFRLRGSEGLGLGDVKLAAVAGAWLGPAALAPACLAATLAALAGVLIMAVARGRKSLNPRMHVPFGSFIAPTVLAFWLGKMHGATPFW